MLGDLTKEEARWQQPLNQITRELQCIEQMVYCWVLSDQNTLSIIVGVGIYVVTKLTEMTIKICNDNV